MGEDHGLDSSQSKKLSKQDRAQAEDVIQRLIENSITSLSIRDRRHRTSQRF